MNIPPRKPLRLWPGVVILILQWTVRFALPAFVPDAMPIGIMGEFLGGLGIVLWWLFLSRAPWSERLGGVVLTTAALFTTSRLVHESIATGAQGMLLILLAVPSLSLAAVAWAVASRHLSKGPRRAAMVVAILLACGVWTLVRTTGFTGSFHNDLKWRWSKTPEERLMAQSNTGPAAFPPAQAGAEVPEQPLGVESGKVPAPPRLAPSEADKGAEWPGFRGPHRDSAVRGVRIKTDWVASPPIALWRRPVGPGWSSFAVHGGLLYTQEQRGPEEVVGCYKVATGEPVWAHRDRARFWESNGGAGPRGTPALGDGRVYALGATGMLNALDARDGAVVWSRNTASDTGNKVPQWGFASSPLVTGDAVIVAASGQLIAYDPAAGARRWSGPARGVSYSSPHLLNIDGVPQILLLGERGATSVTPADGAVLWEHPWPGFASLQPALTADDGVLITTATAAGGIGMRRLAVAHGPAGWAAEERWTSNGLKPYFNDFVVHNGHAFGFDGGVLACIDVQDGKREWKGGRYGYGQLLLLADQDLLLVLSEEGELALVRATPDRFTELARLTAIEGKTWNHPALAGDVLLVRNGEEMAAFQLPLADR